MELTFVHQYGDMAPKRRRLAKACESCRARKKRCVHFAGAKSSDGDTNPERTPATSNHSTDKALPSISNSRRFFSDMIPEATFLQRQATVTEKPEDPNKDIGVWVDKREWDELARQRDISSNTERKESGNLRPHSAILAPLIDIYFLKIHPFLPILDEAEFRRDRAEGLVPEALTYALCLTAAKASDAEPHLRLTESTAPISTREFCSTLHASIMNALNVPCRFEKITLIRILALASLHAEGSDGSEESSLCLNKAMHYTQTLGWHLGQHTSIATGDDLTTKRLFWCLWSLDRTNSAIYGRPIMMSDIDISIEPFGPGESGFPAFEIWLNLCNMLNKVISFYRPGNPITMTGWEEDYPSFEDAVDAGRGWDLPQSMLATLHLVYLLVTVLSHRSRGVKYMPRASASYVRQSHCTQELIRLLRSPLLSALHPLPIIPYACSLALSVSYQHVRQAQLQHQQEDARDDFRHCCQILQKLRRTWSSADVITTIAKKVLVQLEKAPDLSSFRVSRFAEGRNSPCPASLNNPHKLLYGISTDDSAHEYTTTNGGVQGATQQHAVASHHGDLFEGMDDLFDTYLDPNYPLNMDDLSFVDDLSPFDWSSVPS